MIDIKILERKSSLFQEDIQNFSNDLNQIVDGVLKSNQKTILLVIYNSQNQKRYVGVKLK